MVYGLSKSTMVNHWWIIGTYWYKNELIAVTKISPTWGYNQQTMVNTISVP